MYFVGEIVVGATAEAGEEETQGYKNFMEWLWRVLALLAGAAGGTVGGYRLHKRKRLPADEIAELVASHPSRAEILSGMAARMEGAEEES